MNRKIVQHGPATHTVSLPAEWLKENKLKKGDEVEMIVLPAKIEIFPNSGTPNVKKIRFDFTDVNSSLIYRKVNGAYIQGYDEIEVTSNKDKIELTSRMLAPFGNRGFVDFNKVVENAHAGMIGFETLMKKDRNFVLKEYATEKGLEFDDSLNQIIKYILLAIENFERMKNKDFSEVIGHAIFIELKINTFCRFCMRILNKKEDGKSEKSHTYYFMIGILERLGDAYFDLVHYAKGKDKKKLFETEITDIIEIMKKGLSDFMEKKYQNNEKTYSDFRLLQIRIQEEKTGKYEPFKSMLDLYGEVFQTWIEMKL